MSLDVTTLSGIEIGQVIPDLARLRISVFREYPYLYDGSEGYERDYLQTYLDSPSAFAVIVRDRRLPPDRQIVGASTALPLADESTAFQQPFREQGIDVGSIFYFAESVLLPEYRGQGVYRQFFQQREAFARQLGRIDHACFCAVVRPEEHPLKPSGYQPLDSIWRHFGFQPRLDLITEYRWQDVNQDAETAHPMQFWLKPLRP